MNEPVKWRNDIIDPQIKRLLRDLNAAGFKTNSSCQGRRRMADYKNQRHTEHAYIGFENSIPAAIRRRAKRLGLNIYNGNSAITALPGWEIDRSEIFILNKGFESKVRQAFGLVNAMSDTSPTT